MIVFVDTNVLFSSILYPLSIPSLVINKILTGPFDLAISDYCLQELIVVFKKKAPNALDKIDAFVSTSSRINVYKVSNVTIDIEKNLRDLKDGPVIRGAIENCADIIITGDKDLLELKIDKPVIITPREFLENY